MDCQTASEKATIIEYLLYTIFWRKIKLKKVLWRKLSPCLFPPLTSSHPNNNSSWLALLRSLLPCARSLSPRYRKERPSLKAFNSFLLFYMFNQKLISAIDLSNPVLFLIISPNASFNFHSHKNIPLLQFSWISFCSVFIIFWVMQGLANYILPLVFILPEEESFLNG